jgi:hypothetical protein
MKWCFDCGYDILLWRFNSLHYNMKKSEAWPINNCQLLSEKFDREERIQKPWSAAPPSPTLPAAIAFLINQIYWKSGWLSLAIDEEEMIVNYQYFVICWRYILGIFFTYCESPAIRQKATPLLSWSISLCLLFDLVSVPEHLPPLNLSPFLAGTFSLFLLRERMNDLLVPLTWNITFCSVYYMISMNISLDQCYIKTNNRHVNM